MGKSNRRITTGKLYFTKRVRMWDRIKITNREFKKMSQSVYFKNNVGYSALIRLWVDMMFKAIFNKSTEYYE